MRMDKNLKKLTVLTAIAIMTVAVVYAVIVWKYTTEITVKEPFEVKTNLPAEISLYPGTYDYWITVTNHGGEPLNATLYYTVTTTNCNVTITPANKTSYNIPAGETTTISVSITISVDGYPANGTATIDWWIERVKPTP
jgi:hypothetical protein